MSAICSIAFTGTQQALFRLAPLPFRSNSTTEIRMVFEHFHGSSAMGAHIQR